MILYRRLGIIYDQEELADFFNVKIHPKLSGCFTKKFKTTTNRNDDEGLKTIEEQDNINYFFQRNKLKLQAKAYTYTNIQKFGGLQKFVVYNLKQNSDMWLEYKLEGIWDGYQGIHDGLIESIEGDKLTVINPGYDTPNRYSFSLSLVEEAISDKFARETGIIVIN